MGYVVLMVNNAFQMSKGVPIPLHALKKGDVGTSLALKGTRHHMVDARSRRRGVSNQHYANQSVNAALKAIFASAPKWVVPIQFSVKKTASADSKNTLVASNRA